MPESKDLFREVRLLSKTIAKRKAGAFLHETAMMDPVWRGIIGYIDAYKMVTGDKSLDEFRKPSKRIGQALWPRTELSDLGLMVGDAKLEESDLSSFDEELDQYMKEKKAKKVEI